MSKSARNSVGQFALDAAADGIARAPGLLDRRLLLDRIGNFLLDHGLDISPGNLALAQAVVSGSNPDWSRRIAARRLANEPITQAWLDSLPNDDAPNSEKNLAAELAYHFRVARKTGERLSVASCNIDGLTAINASHGRDTGDRVIQAVGRVLQRISAQNCHVARDAGADFAVLFYGVAPAQAADQLNQARENFARRKLVDRTTRSEIGSVSFSGGVADVLASAHPQAALDAADEALRAAKAQGRNRIVIAATPSC